ncbi:MULTISPECIES: hypothetical protein [Pseudomonas]|nr:MULTISPECIES: hypothetical protein [Pseudomonas]KAB0490865.1 hypothetical protein F7Q95_10095 [Pseudomonas psychrophila]KMM99994.1 hypothetical protein TU76_12465 [Pseudomonas psychrophila]MCH4883125.1 hypothetical protein [Pseudomonas sp. TMW22080]QIE34521.1 hypothetical protein G5J76_20610 [Pseudomonas psychrophila]WVI96624.1 hypothetical protein VR624_17780 [Pseudomonas psychrophila]
MDVDFGQILIACYRTHNRPLLDDAKAFVWKAALYQLNQALLAFSRTRPRFSIAGEELTGCLGIFEFQSKSL